MNSSIQIPRFQQYLTTELISSTWACSETTLAFQNFNIKPADNSKHNKSLVTVKNNSLLLASHKTTVHP